MRWACRPARSRLMPKFWVSVGLSVGRGKRMVQALVLPACMHGSTFVCSDSPGRLSCSSRGGRVNPFSAHSTQHTAAHSTQHTAHSTYSTIQTAPCGGGGGQHIIFYRGNGPFFDRDALLSRSSSSTLLWLFPHLADVSEISDRKFH